MSSELGISSIVDLHRVTTGTHDDVRDMLSDPQASGDCLRNDFSRFYFAFKGIKQCSADTAAAVTMYHASRVSQGPASRNLCRYRGNRSDGSSGSRHREAARQASNL